MLNYLYVQKCLLNLYLTFLTVILGHSTGRKLFFFTDAHGYFSLLSEVKNTNFFNSFAEHNFLNLWTILDVVLAHPFELYGSSNTASTAVGITFLLCSFQASPEGLLCSMSPDNIFAYTFAYTDFVSSNMVIMIQTQLVMTKYCWKIIPRQKQVVAQSAKFYI